MLQINAGVLFRNTVVRKNRLDGIFYSNADFAKNKSIVTDVGTMKQSSLSRIPNCYIYTLTEKFDGTEDEQLLSYPVEEYLDEFTSLATFGLNALFSINDQVIKNFTNEDSKLNNFHKSLVKNFFDNNVNISHKEILFFKNIIKNYLILDPDHNKIAKQAIKTFEHAIHHIPDNPTLAYTLLVSSLDTIKEGKISLQDYVIQLIGKDCISLEDKWENHPIRNSELDTLLKNAYGIRSNYIHNANPNQLISTPSNYKEVIILERNIYLTLQGLIVITRHAIRKYIEISPKISKETISKNSRREKDDMQTVSQNWTWTNPSEYKLMCINFEELLIEITNCMLKKEKIYLIDLQKIEKDIGRTFNISKNNEKLLKYAISYICNYYNYDNKLLKKWSKFLNENSKYFKLPKSEILIVRTLTHMQDWPISVHEQAFNEYFKAKNKRIRATIMIEAAMILELAERFRNLNESEKVMELLKKSVEYFPQHRELHNFISKFNMRISINWEEILIL